MRHSSLPVDRMAEIEALAQSILDNFRNERAEGGAFSEEYKAHAQKLLDILFPDMESVDATWPQRVDAALNGKEGRTC